MTGHAKETTMLWDAFDPKMQITAKTDNRDEPTPQYVSDPHELSELCPVCEDGFIGPDGICVVCWHLG